MYIYECFVHSMFFVKRGSSESNLPKIDTTAASIIQPHHAMVGTESLLVSVFFTALWDITFATKVW